MKEERKLRTILFADIVGYTAAMQKDEASGLEMLESFKSIVSQEVATHSGEVIQYIGDACLVTFDSATQGVQGAAAMQEKFKSAHIPVRIGMHTAEVTIREGDVFGDGVNLASRIESMSVAGGVFVSKSLHDQLKSQGEFNFHTLGSFEFKNIQLPVAVYALAIPGFIPPKRSELIGKFKRKKQIPYWWYGVLFFLVGSIIYLLTQKSNRPPAEVLDKKLSVLVFDNQTSDPGLEVFGSMISDWVTKGLMDIGEPNVINAANFLTAGTTRTPEEKRKILTDQGEVDVVLDGRYYQLEGKLIVQSNLLDARTGKVIYALDPISGNPEELQRILTQFTDQVLDFWNVKDKPRFLENPPDLEAYKAYQEGYGLQITDPATAEALFLKAHQRDTQFFEPVFGLYSLYEKEGKDSLKREIMAYLRSQTTEFTEYEKLRFASWDAIGEQDWLKVGRLSEEMLDMDNSNLTALSNLVVSYGRANYIEKALYYLKRYENRIIGPGGQGPFWWNANQAFFALQQKKYERLDSIITNFDRDIYPDAMVFIHLMSKVLDRDFEALYALLPQYHQKKVIDLSGKPSDFVNGYIVVAAVMYLEGLTEELSYFVPKLDSLVESNKTSEAYAESKGYVHFYKGEYRKAIQSWEKEKLNNVNWPAQFRRTRKADNLARLGVCYALLDETNRAVSYLQLISNLEEEEKEMIGVKKYYSARIKAYLDQDAESLSLLEAAYLNGFHFFGPMRYYFDPFFKPLRDNPRFQNLVAPRTE